MSRIKNKKVTILWGLPGSGKSTWADMVCDRRASNDAVRLDLDMINRYCTKESWDDPMRHVGQDTCGKLNYHYWVVIDGLITTHDLALKIMEAVTQHTKNKFTISWEIVYWNEDRDACLHNDQGRRGENCTESIKHLPLEAPSEQKLKKFKPHIHRLDVVRKAEHLRWAVKSGLANSDTFESESWCLGGTTGSYMGTIHTVSPSAPPASFERFDDLMEEICPQMTFLQYKKIYNQCVTVKESSSHDYYGGTTNYACYVCDVKKLHELLVAMNLITP